MDLAVLAAAGASAADIQRYVGREDVGTTLGTYGAMTGGPSVDVLANAAPDTEFWARLAGAPASRAPAP